MKTDLTTAPTTDPTSVYRWRDGLYAADLLTCALVHLDLFSWLADRPSSKERICSHYKIAERPTDVMLTLFQAMGYLERRGDVFSVTPIAREHLVRSSPFFLGPYYASLKSRPVCEDFLQVLLTDKPANWGSFKSEKDWARAMEDEMFANNFTEAMDCRGVFLGQALAKALDLSSYEQLLDIAGGSGIYACALVDHWKMFASVYEKSPVDKLAERVIAQRGFSERVQVIEGELVDVENREVVAVALQHHRQLSAESAAAHDDDVHVVTPPASAAGRLRTGQCARRGRARGSARTRRRGV